VPSAIISLTLIAITTLSYVASSLVNPFLIGTYLSYSPDKGYATHNQGVVELITSLLTLLMLFIGLAVSAIPAVIEGNRKHLKYLEERDKKNT
jgi:predicted PurR-regulated permease PerM